MALALIMKPEYTTFLNELIDKRRKQFGSWGDDLSIRELVHHQCWEFSTAFVERFPNLRLERGKVCDIEHYWTVDDDGTIVDPTAQQFIFEADVLEYEVFDPETTEIYMGTCPNCGEKHFAIPNSPAGLAYQDLHPFCNSECAEDYAAYVTRDARKW